MSIKLANMSGNIEIVTETTPVKKMPQANLPDFSTRMNRRKSVDSANILETNLRRCLTTFDITLLAVGHMIGSGVYVIISSVAKNVAGPAIILSFLLSGIASVLSALCYAELGVRYPKAGSAYSYTYLAVGELWAFMVGWNMALEHVIGAAATARACSAYIDSLIGGSIKAAVVNSTGSVSEFFSIEYLDFFAFAILKIIVIFLSFGVRITSYMNNLFSIVNLAVIATIIGIGSYFADFTNWTNPDTGGFMPYGWSGVLAASASCFYAFIGFDSIAAAGEEANMPQKTIPRATMISMAIATVSYMGVSSVLTLMVNYKDITGDSGLPDAIGSHGLQWAKILVVIGAACGMFTAIVGSIFALTRVIYGMAEDGLLLAFCAKVSSRTKTPLRTMYLFTFISGIMTMCLDINSLVEVMSIGALLAYLVVSISVIVLRYRKIAKIMKPEGQELETIGENRRSSFIEDHAGELKKSFQFLKKYKFFPTRMLYKSIGTFVVSTTALCGFTKGCYFWITNGYWWAVLTFVSLLLCVILSLVTISLHQQSNAVLRYKVPFVPLVPALSIFINITLIVNLHLITWVRLLVWMVVGLSIYFSYGIEHSKLDVAMRTPKSWGPDETDPASQKKAVFTKRAKPPPVSTSLSRQFLFSNMDPVP